ncbi:hypothetical protein C0992_005013 [Termitomyces sp. T32_za158]|nr:hypothetical protein C0992_005013 [Termitomyces sp. T32_za158]
MSGEAVLILPDLLANWPWKRVVNPHLSPQIKAESMEWIQSFVSTPRMQGVFDRGEFAAARGRFIKSFDDFTKAVVTQAHDRALEYVRDIDEYLPIRRETIGAKQAFIALEFDLNLPDEVFEDPIIQSVIDACSDLISLDNDLHSHNVEQARGDEGHNLITILMHHRHLTLNDAVAWISNYVSKLVQSVLNDLSHVPSFGEEYQADVERYLNGLCNWVRAYDSWQFESGKYFGMHGLEIQKTRKVVLLPRQWLVLYF